MTHCSIVNINHRHRLKNDKLMLYVFRKDIAYSSQLYQISSQWSLEDNSRGKKETNKKGDEQHLPFHCIHGTQPTI